MNILVSDVISKRFFRLKSSDTVSQALSLLKRTDYLGGIVFDREGKYRGVVYLKDLIRLKIDPKKVKIKYITKSVAVLSLEEELTRAAKLMLDSGSRILPVEKNGKIVGVVYDLDILRAFMTGEGLEKKVEDVMTKDFVSLDWDSSTAKAINLTINRKISHLAIMKEEKLVGIVSIRDIAEKMMFRRVSTTRGEFIGERIKALSIPIRGLMSSLIVMVKKGTKVSDCVRIIGDDAVGSLVVREGGVVRIVSRRDILRCISNLELGEGEEINYQFLGDISFLNNVERKLVSKLVKSFMKNIGKWLKGDLIIHLSRHKGVRKVIFELRSKFLTGEGEYYASCQDYNFVECLRTLLNILRRKVTEERESIRRRTRVKRPPDIFFELPRYIMS